jgi:hypothetical protein
VSGAQCRREFLVGAMSRLSKESPEAEFRRILGDVRRAEASDDDPARQEREFAIGAPSLSIESLFSIDEATAPGDASHWAAALAWLEDQDEPAASAAAPQPPRDASPEAILDELGLSERLTHDEISQLRRLYMWRNHPDRHSEAERENATRRVAIANMLLDRAQARLINDRRS